MVERCPGTVHIPLMWLHQVLVLNTIFQYNAIGLGWGQVSCSYQPALGAVTAATGTTQGTSMYDIPVPGTSSHVTDTAAAGGC